MHKRYKKAFRRKPIVCVLEKIPEGVRPLLGVQPSRGVRVLRKFSISFSALLSEIFVGRFQICLVVGDHCRVWWISRVQFQSYAQILTRAQHPNPTCTCPDLLCGSRDRFGWGSPQLIRCRQQALQGKKRLQKFDFFVSIERQNVEKPRLRSVL